jgi:hypothetical protein
MGREFLGGVAFRFDGVGWQDDLIGGFAIVGEFEWRLRGGSSKGCGEDSGKREKAFHG